MSQPSPPHLGPEQEDASLPLRFDAEELAMVLSHYDIGPIRRIENFPRGSRRAPKARVSTTRGEFLLKRRAPGRDDPYRVAFSHSLQLFLAAHGYPVPRLLGTRSENNSMLQLDGRVYELFEFIESGRFDKSAESTQAAGRALGDLHRLLSEFHPRYKPPAGTYHAVDIEGHLARIPFAIAMKEPQISLPEFSDLCTFLGQAYAEAAARVNKRGYLKWPPVIVHGDWHPGNVRFRGQRVAAVLDFDSVRIEPRIADLANAALQFAMPMPEPTNPDSWPAEMDTARIAALLAGYDEGTRRPAAKGERQALGWLMIEALIVEAIVPIAATGSFARIPGSSFMRMVQRKVQWLLQHALKPDDLAPL